jgi:hypothetical protein
MAISSIRRQVYELSIPDLTEHPIWEFCSNEEHIEGQDEATVRPSGDKEVPGYSSGAYVVVADITFADGTEAIGYLYSGKPHDFACTQPNVIVGSSQINFWLGAFQFVSNVDDQIANKYHLLQKNQEMVFPIRFQSRVHVNNSPLLVIVEGFMALDKDRQIIFLR